MAGRSPKPCDSGFPVKPNLSVVEYRFFPARPASCARHRRNRRRPGLGGTGQAVILVVVPLVEAAEARSHRAYRGEAPIVARIPHQRPWNVGHATAVLGHLVDTAFSLVERFFFLCMGKSSALNKRSFVENAVERVQQSELTSRTVPKPTISGKHIPFAPIWIHHRTSIASQSAAFTHSMMPDGSSGSELRRCVRNRDSCLE